jgi:hypothetical protein
LCISSTVLSAAPLSLVSLLFADTSSRQQYTVVPREVWRWTPIRSHLAAFLSELTRSVADAEEGIASFLLQHGKPGDVVKASYGDISLMYYVPHMQVTSRWDSGGGVPDFVIVRDPFPLAQDRGFLDSVRGVRHEAVTLEVPDVAWANNPDPLFHRFSSGQDEPGVVVYRRLHGESESGESDSADASH